MHSVAWKAYDDASRHFFETYEGLRFSTMHRSFLRFLPPPGALCLDVGAGSGRDAAALARRGYQVTAVEPSGGLRRLAEQHHANQGITWIDDALPNLEKVLAQSNRYRFILLSAVWMHIPPNQRLQSLMTLSRLLEPDGYIALTLRLGMPCHDRVMYSVSVEELLDHAKQAGLSVVYVSRRIRDSLKRSDITWRKVVLAKA
jgi:2-polyprenyl-3-methyl-5-hydroxy-6-metoxy-1,4-benzoquinol methylase